MCLNKISKHAKTFANALSTNGTIQKAEHPCVPTNFCDDEAERRCNLRAQPQKFLCQSDVKNHTINGDTAVCQIDPSHTTNSFMTLSGDYFIVQDLGPAAEKNFRSTATKHTGKTTKFFLY